MVIERLNGPLIAQVAKLWIPPRSLVVDVTFGKGNFWTEYEPQFFITHDLKTDGVDFRHLPEDSGSVDVLVFDPPYISPGGRKTSTIPDFNEAYGLVDAPRTPYELALLLHAGVKEARRVLRPRGLLLQKCSDYITSGKFYQGHRRAVATAEAWDFVQTDEFVHASGPGPQPEFNLDGSTRTQKHSRRVHSFLLVFEKSKP